MYYAVIQLGYAIIGVGETREEAITDANAWADNAFVNLPDYADGVSDNEIVVAEITKELYNHVEKFGGDVLYDYDEEKGLFVLDNETELV